MIRRPRRSTPLYSSAASDVYKRQVGGPVVRPPTVHAGAVSDHRHKIEPLIRSCSGRVIANPVLPGFHPDPSVCRVGDVYYLVVSSFGYYPGIPVYRSLDLVDWTLIGHVLYRPEQLDLDGLDVADGVWASTIRHHDGTFY